MFSYKAKLIEVIDGDTVDLQIDLGFSVCISERFRLYGIDAPEMKTEAGKVAKAWLQTTLFAEELFVETIKAKRGAKIDKYGRFLAILYFDSEAMAKNIGENKIEMMPESINWQMCLAKQAVERYW